jgi:hypothetical protein
MKLSTRLFILAPAILLATGVAYAEKYTDTVMLFKKKAGGQIRFFRIWRRRQRRGGDCGGLRECGHYGCDVRGEWWEKRCQYDERRLSKGHGGIYHRQRRPHVHGDRCRPEIYLHTAWSGPLASYGGHLGGMTLNAI